MAATITVDPSTAYATSGSFVGGGAYFNTQSYSPTNFVPFLNNTDTQARAVSVLATGGNMDLTATAVGVTTKATASVLGF